MSFWIALGADFFKDEGLDVQVIVPPNPMRTGQFLLQARADVAVLPPPMYLPLIGEEAPILVFANLLENDQINLIVRKEVVAERGLSTTAPLVERLQGIRGLTVGVAPGPPTRLRVLFASVGLDADRDIEMVIVHGPEQNQAFEDGLVDALYAHTAYLEWAIVQQGAVVLVNQSAGEVPELAGRQSHSLVTIRTFAGAQREVLVAMARAVHRAQQLIHTDQQAAIRALLQSGVPGLDREQVETIVGIYAPAIPATPDVSVDGVIRVHALYPAHQTPPDLSGIDLSKYVALDIAQEATGEPSQGSSQPGSGGGDGSGRGDGSGGGG
jgi:ABC-type nitrate/sulfonate/bicarbonate transport system substrate-binding protein